MSCSRFPECKYTKNIVETLPDQHCPLCGEGDVVVKNTRWGKPFYGCSLYPKCDFASWKKPEPNYKLTQEEWAEIKKKREEWKARMNKNKKPATKTKAVAKTKTKAKTKTVVKTKKTTSKAKKK
jgi:ssDNA-binding Zn-finger/Zn-ribbon topoisomerase 1